MSSLRAKLLAAVAAAACVVAGVAAAEEGEDALFEVGGGMEDNAEVLLEVEGNQGPLRLNWKTFLALWEAYPKTESGPQIRKRLGGRVDNDDYHNTCAIRMSDAWNKVAKTMPGEWSPLAANPPITKVLGQHANSVLTVRSAAGDNVAIRARELHDLLHSKLGPAKFTTWEQITAEHGRAGIVAFYECTFGSNKSGNHIDLFMGGTCRGACYNEPMFGCKYKFFPVEGSGGKDGTCRHAGLDGVCADQVECVEKSGGAKWPAFVPEQCGGLAGAPNMKCCLGKK